MLYSLASGNRPELVTSIIHDTICAPADQPKGMTRSAFLSAQLSLRLLDRRERERERERQRETETETEGAEGLAHSTGRPPAEWLLG